MFSQLDFLCVIFLQAKNHLGKRKVIFKEVPYLFILIITSINQESAKKRSEVKVISYLTL